MTFYDNTWLSLDLSAVVCLRMKRGVRNVMPAGVPEHTPPRMALGIRAPGMVPLPVCVCVAPRAAETALRGSWGAGTGGFRCGSHVPSWPSKEGPSCLLSASRGPGCALVCSLITLIATCISRWPLLVGLCPGTPLTCHCIRAIKSPA